MYIGLAVPFIVAICSQVNGRQMLVSLFLVTLDLEFESFLLIRFH